MSSNDYFTLKHRSFNTTQLLNNVRSLSKDVQRHRFVGSTAENNPKSKTDLYLNIVDNNGYEENQEVTFSEPPLFEATGTSSLVVIGSSTNRGEQQNVCSLRSSSAKRKKLHPIYTDCGLTSVLSNPKSPTFFNSQEQQPKKKRKKWEILYQEDREKKERKLWESSQYENVRRSKEIEECSFQPNISNKKVENHLHENLTPRSLKNIFERQLKWKKDRDLRIKQKQNEKVTSELEGLTFRPQISPLQKNQQRKGQLEGSMRAVEQFINRMNKAKTLKEERSHSNSNSRVFRQKAAVGMSQSPSVQCLSAISQRVTSQFVTPQRSPCQKENQCINFDTQDATLPTSMYLQNKYSLKKSSSKSPAKALLPKNVQKSDEYQAQQFYVSVTQANYDQVMSTLHLQIMNFEI